MKAVKKQDSASKPPFKELIKSYKESNVFYDPDNSGVLKMYSTNKSQSSSKKKSLKKQRVDNSRSGQKSGKKQSFIQKASSSFKKGFGEFWESTGNILKQVKQEMAQEDFAFSNAFKKYKKVNSNISPSKNFGKKKSIKPQDTSCEIPKPKNYFGTSKSSLAYEKQTNESSTTTCQESEKSKLPRQNSMVIGRVAPLNYKRRSKSPRFDELMLKYGNLNKVVSQEVAPKDLKDEGIDHCEKRQKHTLPPRTKIVKLHTMENKTETSQVYHKIPQNTVKRNLDLINPKPANTLKNLEKTQSMIESKLPSNNTPIAAPFA